MSLSLKSPSSDSQRVHDSLSHIKVIKTFSKNVEGCTCRFWQCQKPQKLDRVVAVSRQDRVYKDYTSNPIPTSFFLHDSTVYT